jgi:hypothetical protein
LPEDEDRRAVAERYRTASRVLGEPDAPVR